MEVLAVIFAKVAEIQMHPLEQNPVAIVGYFRSAFLHVGI